MKPYWHNERHGLAIYHGDCMDWLGTARENGVDMIATDPPYGWSFMGREWDRALPDPAIWRECLRVLKPGGAACVMSGARLDCLWRVCRDLEEAGFELSQSCLTWVYRSGFPKGGDLSKMADKRAGMEREVVGENPRASSGRHRMPSGPGMTMAIKGQSEEIEPQFLTAPATPLAVALDGQFTKGKLKPAMEFIIWARKPISEATELDNVVRWGTGAVNCGKCMVPTDGPIPVNVLEQWSGLGQVKQPKYEQKQQNGRFPANVLCMDDALGEGSRYFDIDSWAAEHGIAEDGWADAAAAGMIQVPKPSRGEKNQGCEGLPEREKRILSGGALPYLESDAWDATNRRGRPMSNAHPSVKPVRLFSYLIHLLCPSGGLVLDPFCGSGTTGVAAVQAGYQFIGCDMEQEYCEIARARIEHAVLDAEIAQGRLFEPAETAPKPVQATLEVDA